ncbi:hypothetical protein GX50_03276 [[Emmonsia] crescens]|uniref:Uncharacterized protein n=1 Tax=[Emmonsia] crescens TaxID=73230 RepID=A0A2B7ZIS0_9EURO|nr:hypothetical protein GX50_03276 [Emmonsia crescens]
MPPKKKFLENPTRPDKPLQPQTTTTKIISLQRTQQQARRTLPPSKSRVNRQRQHRLALGGNTRSQKTLTQIDFVKQAQALLARDDENEDGADLGYIDGENGDGDYGMGSVRSSKGRKSSGNGKGGSSRKKAGSRTAGRKKANEIDEEDDDRTLTQMGYVMPSKGWDHDSRNHQLQAGLGWVRRGVQMETIGEEPEAELGDGALQEARTNGEDQMGRRTRKRKASEVDAECRPAQNKPPPSRDFGGGPSSEAPRTPRKPIRLVIPSSQSPDSPDLMIYPWTFKEPPPRFPLAPQSRNMTPKKAASPFLKSEYKTPIRVSQVAQYEIPESSFDSAGISSPIRSCAEEPTVGFETTPTTSPPVVPEEDSNKTLSTLFHSLPNQLKEEDPKTDPGNSGTNVRDAEKSKNTVIYETDAESGDEEFHDSIPHISGDEIDSWRTQSQLFHDSRSRNEEDDDNNILHALPSQRSNSDQETYNDLPGTTLGSGPSMLYYRKPMSSAFDPGSELDNIDTQRLAELFPDPQAENQECAIHPLSTIPEEHEAEHEKPDDAPTRRSAENSHTDFVPNSPPRQQPDNTAERNIPPPSSPPVVLVASSQQNDMGDAEPDLTECIDSQSNYWGLVTASQLLTDSMMESVPGPPMWTSSQYLSQEEQENTVET